MGETTRFGVSLDAGLLASFDSMCARHGYANRSEAIRDCLRAALTADAWESDKARGVGVLTLVYEHHRHDVSANLTAMQHEVRECVVASLHVHLDHDNCLEVIVLRGAGTELRAFAQRLLATRGVTHGALTLTVADAGKGL